MKCYCRVILGLCHKPWNQDFTECHRWQNRSGKILQLWSIFPGVWMVWVGPKKHDNWEITKKWDLKIGRVQQNAKMYLKFFLLVNFRGSWAVNLPTAWPQDVHFYGGTEHVAVPRSPTCGSPRWLDDDQLVFMEPRWCGIARFPLSNDHNVHKWSPKNPNHSAGGICFRCFQSFTTKKMRKMNPRFDDQIFFNLVNPLQKQIFESCMKFLNMGAPNQSLL